MVSPNHPDEYGFWQGEFAPDESGHPNDDQYQYFIPLTAADVQAGPRLSGTFGHDDASDVSGGNSPPFLLGSDYDLQFGAPPLAQAPLPPLPPLEFGDIVDLLAVYPEGASAPGPDTPALGPPGSSQAMGSGPVQIPTSYPSHANNAVAFGGQSLSVSVPGNLRNSQAPAYPDAHRTRSSSYAGTTLTPYDHSIPLSGFPTPPTLGFNGTFQVEFQDVTRGPTTMMSPLSGPTQHILHFDSDGHEHDHARLPPTIHPSSIPLPASPSEESSFASSPTLSPATSTSSLVPYPPSPRASRTETFRWRLNAQEDQKWKCHCVTKAKKKKRHMESCPSNPSKPRIKCDLCAQHFTGGSRKSALSKHMSNIHGRKSGGSDRKKKDKRGQ